jgi:hypothetical protein
MSTNISNQKIFLRLLPFSLFFWLTTSTTSLFRETLHDTENTPEVRLILRALPPPFTYDAVQQSFSPTWFISFEEEKE